MNESMNEWRMVEWMDEWMTEQKNEWMNGWMDGWVNAWMNEWMNGWMSERKNEWMNEWMDECKNDWVDEWVNGWGPILFKRAPLEVLPQAPWLFLTPSHLPPRSLTLKMPVTDASNTQRVAVLPLPLFRGQLQRWERVRTCYTRRHFSAPLPERFWPVRGASGVLPVNRAVM